MPTVLRSKGYRFFFYSNEHLPKHIHVEKENKTAKFELEPVQLVKSRHFNAAELKQAGIIISKNREIFIRNWNEYFSNT